MSNSLWPHGLQHARLPCPSPTPAARSKSCPSSWWCHTTILSFVIPLYIPLIHSPYGYLLICVLLRKIYCVTEFCFLFFLSNIVLLSPHACGNFTPYLGSMQSSPWTAFSLLEASLLLFAMLGWGSARNGSLWHRGMFLMMSTRVDWRTPDTCSLNFTQFSHSGSFRDWWVYMPTRTESRVLFPRSQHHLRSSAFFQTDWYKETIF